MLEERILEILLSTIVKKDKTIQQNVQNQLKHIIIKAPIKNYLLRS